MDCLPFQRNPGPQKAKEETVWSPGQRGRETGCLGIALHLVGHRWSKLGGGLGGAKHHLEAKVLARNRQCTCRVFCEIYRNLFLGLAMPGADGLHNKEFST